MNLGNFSKRIREGYTRRPKTAFAIYENKPTNKIMSCIKAIRRKYKISDDNSLGSFDRYQLLTSNLRAN